MKQLVIVCLLFFLLMSCGTTTRLDIPTRFAEQADRLEVKGAYSRHISFGKYSTTKIRRGWNIASTRYSRRFFPENLILNQVGIHKTEVVQGQKNKFSFNIADGQRTADVYASEFEGNKSYKYRLGPLQGMVDAYQQMRQYQYLFSATIIADTTSAPWQLYLSNSYNRNTDSTKTFFPAFNPGDDGMITHGRDTIVVRSLNLKKATRPDGREGNYPVKILSGYEFRIQDGVVAIVDNIGKYVWFYNQLDDETKLVVAAAVVSIFAKRIKDVKW